MINASGNLVAINPEQLGAMNARIKTESRRLDELSANLKSIISGLDWEIRATPAVAAKILSLNTQITKNANLLRTHAANSQSAYEKLSAADTYLSNSMKEMTYIMSNFSANSRTVPFITLPRTDLGALSKVI